MACKDNEVISGDVPMPTTSVIEDAACVSLTPITTATTAHDGSATSDSDVDEDDIKLSSPPSCQRTPGANDDNRQSPSTQQPENSVRTQVSSYVILSNKIRRAKRRTVRMTVTIIVTFIVCWTPYVAVVFWYQVDEDTAKRIDQWFKDGLFTFAVANSCVNPLVYGSHIFKNACRRTTDRCRQCTLL